MPKKLNIINLFIVKTIRNMLISSYLLILVVKSRSNAQRLISATQKGIFSLI